VGVAGELPKGAGGALAFDGILVVEDEVLVGAEAVGGVVAGSDGLAGGGDRAFGPGAVAAGGLALLWGALFHGRRCEFGHRSSLSTKQ
jgi:hypothetical protein